MAVDKQMTGAIQNLVLSAKQLKSLSFTPEVSSALLTLASLGVLRHNLGRDRILFVGLIGCTGTGKSTLFNSMAGQAVSRTGWRAHNTCGPVVLIQDTFLKAIEDLEQRFGPLLLPAFQRGVLSPGESASTAGAPGIMQLIQFSSRQQNPIALIDLPDINTTLARDDNLLALEILPWLDAVVFLVDDETIYHRDYEKPVAATNELKQSRLCVLNNRGRDRVDLDHHDLIEAKSFYGVERIHVLPEIRGKDRFANEPEFTQFKQDLFNLSAPAPDPPLFKRIAGLAKTIIEENQQRLDALNSLEEETSVQIQNQIAKQPTISLEKILNDDVLQALNHLGLKRFAITNVAQFFKRVFRTGSLKRSFQIAFGDRKNGGLSQIFRMDGAKLETEVATRLADGRERIHELIRRDQLAESIPVLSSRLREMDARADSESYKESLKKIVEEFERECQNLIAQDSVSASIKNDPLLAVALLTGLIVDFATIPYFGSWLLVPSAFKYLPLGKFESAKRRFQKSIQDVIEQNLFKIRDRLREIRGGLILEKTDPLFKALQICAGYSGHEN